MSLKIYYIDDEKELCENFTDYFSSDQVSIVTFVDAQKAIEAITKNPPDMIFIDYRLPGTTGDDVAQILDPKIPKFLITGDISVKTTYAFNNIFYKPYKEKDIADTIEFFLKQKNSQAS